MDNCSYRAVLTRNVAVGLCVSVAMVMRPRARNGSLLLRLLVVVVHGVT